MKYEAFIQLCDSNKQRLLASETEALSQNMVLCLEGWWEILLEKPIALEMIPGLQRLDGAQVVKTPYPIMPTTPCCSQPCVLLSSY